MTFRSPWITARRRGTTSGWHPDRRAVFSRLLLLMMMRRMLLMAGKPLRAELDPLPTLALHQSPHQEAGRTG